MRNFIEHPANKNSLAKRKLIFGVGINDSTYKTKYKNSDGKNVVCPYYERWKNLLVRGYSEKYKTENPTYADCSVCDEWLTFSKFKNWMIKQDWEEKCLDKDLIDPSNKKYCPEKCLFVTSQINSLLLTRTAARGIYPLGVTFHKQANKFTAQLRIDNKNVNLGLYKTPLEASKVYNKRKAELIIEVANNQPPIIKKALLKHAKLFANGLIE